MKRIRQSYLISEDMRSEDMTYFASHNEIIKRSYVRTFVLSFIFCFISGNPLCKVNVFKGKPVVNFIVLSFLSLSVMEIFTSVGEPAQLIKNLTLRSCYVDEWDFLRQKLARKQRQPSPVIFHNEMAIGII